MHQRRLRLAEFLLLAARLLTLMTTTCAYAVNNSPQGVIRHVIIVIQENRTPDNLFYLDTNLIDNGADVHPQANQVKCDGNQVPLAAYDLDTCFDPKHLHLDWTSMFHNGDMQGACHVRINTSDCTSPPDCNANQTCPYGYANNPEWDRVHHYTLLQPYFEIAEHYGFGNRMHQTNQGQVFRRTCSCCPGPRHLCPIVRETRKCSGLPRRIRSALAGITPLPAAWDLRTSM